MQQISEDELPAIEAAMAELRESLSLDYVFDEPITREGRAMLRRCVQFGIVQRVYGLDPDRMFANPESVTGQFGLAVAA